MKKTSNSFVSGAIALVFAVIGYQTALLVHYSATARIAANRDSPDTVFVYCSEAVQQKNVTAREEHRLPFREERRVYSSHSATAYGIRKKIPAQKTESFRFNPNTCTQEELIRLGFSPKQASAIVSYRNKGGRFRRKDDFARSHAVPDSIFHRLERYINIPKTDLNKADSAEFDTLPGIGGWFAAKMVEYRDKLGGYSYPEQLMDIYRFDIEKYDQLKDLICVSTPKPYRLWALPADSLKLHPYIRTFSVARGIVFFREHNPREKWSVDALKEAGIIDEENAAKLAKCLLE